MLLTTHSGCELALHGDAALDLGYGCWVHRSRNRESQACKNDCVGLVFVSVHRHWIRLETAQKKVSGGTPRELSEVISFWLCGMRLRLHCWLRVLPKSSSLCLSLRFRPIKVLLCVCVVRNFCLFGEKLKLEKQHTIDPSVIFRSLVAVSSYEPCIRKSPRVVKI